MMNKPNSLASLENVLLRGIVRDCKAALDASASRAAVILTYSGIDVLAYLGMPPTQKKVTKTDFVTWCDRYLRFDDHLGNSTISIPGLEIYAARCALLHSYGSEADLHQTGEALLQIGYADSGQQAVVSNGATAIIVIRDLVEAFIRGIGNCLSDIVADSTRHASVDTRVASMLHDWPNLPEVAWHARTSALKLPDPRPSIDSLQNVIIDGIIGDMVRLFNAGANRGTLIVAFCAIDAMAFLCMPGPGLKCGKSDFISWCDNYLWFKDGSGIPTLQIPGIEIYAARCTVVHNYSAQLPVRAGTNRLIEYIPAPPLNLPDIKMSANKIELSITGFGWAVNNAIRAAYLDAMKDATRIAHMQRRVRTMLHIYRQP